MRHSSREFEGSDFYFTFSEIYLDELWLAFGTGSNVRYLHIYISMKLLLTWMLEFVLLSQCFMYLQDAILSQHFVAEARRQLEIHRKFIRKSSRHLNSLC